ERGIAIALRGAARRRRRGIDRRLPAPRHLEVLEIAGGDLVERRIARRLRIVAEIAPLAGLGRYGGWSLRLGAQGETCGKRDRKDQAGWAQSSCAEQCGPWSCHGVAPSLLIVLPEI